MADRYIACSCCAREQNINNYTERSLPIGRRRSRVCGFIFVRRTARCVRPGTDNDEIKGTDVDRGLVRGCWDSGASNCERETRHIRRWRRPGRVVVLIYWRSSYNTRIIYPRRTIVSHRGSTTVLPTGCTLWALDRLSKRRRVQNTRHSTNSYGDPKV